MTNSNCKIDNLPTYQFVFKQKEDNLGYNKLELDMKSGHSSFGK